jgi:nucleotide-binding universal stress UspA family protein
MAEIRRILCPVDLSELSRRALDHAMAIATWYEARVTILHVFTVPVPPLLPVSGIGEVLPPAPPLEGVGLLDDVRRFSGVTDAPGARADVVVVEGSPVTEIRRHAETLPADLLVMGTHGRGGFEALFLGSVTDKVLRSTYVPVLTVPPVQRVDTVVYDTILCPIEFSDASTRALEYALTLAEESGARLILLHVIEMLVDAPHSREWHHLSVPEYLERRIDDARARLRAAVPEEARVWCTPEELVVTSGKAYEVILDTASREHADVIVMGVHGKGALNRRLFGSTTHHVIREAHCPVLTLRG